MSSPTPNLTPGLEVFRRRPVKRVRRSRLDRWATPSHRKEVLAWWSGTTSGGTRWTSLQLRFNRCSRATPCSTGAMVRLAPRSAGTTRSSASSCAGSRAGATFGCSRRSLPGSIPRAPLSTPGRQPIGLAIVSRTPLRPAQRPQGRKARDRPALRAVLASIFTGAAKAQRVGTWQIGGATRLWRCEEPTSGSGVGGGAYRR